MDRNPLDYESRERQRAVPPAPPRPLTDREGLIRLLLPVSAFVVLGLAGVSADRITIPPLKKVVLSVGTLAILMAVSGTCRRGVGSDQTYATLCWLILGGAVFVMWFWN